MWFKDGPQPPPEGALDYEEYLRLPDLLSLQRPLSSPAEHDELQFIIVHQTYELWFKLLLHELDEVARRMGGPAAVDADVREAARLVRRCVEIERLLVRQIHILETMLPGDCLRFRVRLKPASGFQSDQIREIEVLTGIRDPSVLAYFAPKDERRSRLDRRLAEPSLRDRFFGLVARRLAAPTGTPAERIEALRRLYASPPGDATLLDLAEALIELDEQLGLWRYHHVRMAERVIGFKLGTGGSEGVAYLAQTLQTKGKAFPELWEVRTHLP